MTARAPVSGHGSGSTVWVAELADRGRSIRERLFRYQPHLALGDVVRAVATVRAGSGKDPKAGLSTRRARAPYAWNFRRLTARPWSRHSARRTPYAEGVSHGRQVGVVSPSPLAWEDPRDVRELRRFLADVNRSRFEPPRTQWMWPHSRCPASGAHHRWYAADDDVRRCRWCSGIAIEGAPTSAWAEP